MSDKNDEETELEEKNSEMKNVKVSMLVKNYLDEQGQKGETYDDILRRLLKISSEGKYGDLEEKIKKCAEGITIWKRTNLPNDYRNIAKAIYNIGYEDNDVKVDIRKSQSGSDNWLCYTVNGVTFAKIQPYYGSISVNWFIKEKGKLFWRGVPLIEREDFSMHFYNFHLKDIRKAYHLAKKMANEIGDRYIDIINRIETIDESLRKFQDELEAIKKKEKIK